MKVKLFLAQASAPDGDLRIIGPTVGGNAMPEVNKLVSELLSNGWTLMAAMPTSVSGQVNLVMAED